MGGKVIVIQSKQEWDSMHASNAGKAIIVDFTASWCGPCRVIAPEFERLSTMYSTVIFLKVDVDNVEAVASECGISAMPTFQVFKDGKKIDEMVGASKEKLNDMVAKYA
eukprot:jgi/Picsp_1/4817/NSC_02185-R1_thioredoxin h